MVVTHKLKYPGDSIAYVQSLARLIDTPTTDFLNNTVLPVSVGMCSHLCSETLFAQCLL